MTAQAAAEQTCRQLRAYRKKLASSSPSSSSTSADAVTPEVQAELDAELRLTLAAISEKVVSSGGGGGGKGGESSSVLGGLLDQYSERLVSMLDERLVLRLSEMNMNTNTGGDGRGNGCGGGGGGGVNSGVERPALLTPPIDADRERGGDS